MTSETTDADWLRQAGRLTAEPAMPWPTDQMLGGEILAMRLVALARALPVPAPTAANGGSRASSADVPCSCAGHDCPLSGLDGGTAACRLATDLAAYAPVTSLDVGGDDLVERYLVALRDAAGAVYFCRRVQHAGGACWFSARGPVDDLCGRVLAVAHASTPCAGR